MGQYLMGIDASTGGSTACVFDVSGNRMGRGFVESVLRYPQPGWIEYREEDVLNGVYGSCKRALEDSGVAAEEILAVALSTQASVFCLLDAGGDVLGEIIGWQDVRFFDYVNQVGSYMDPMDLYEITKVRPESPANYLTKLTWLRGEHPERYEKTAVFCTQQDYLLRRFGVKEHVTDIASIARMSLVDVAKGTYSDQVFEAFQLDKARFPRIGEAGMPVGRVSSEAARRSGLMEGTPLILGAHNQSCQQIGVGALRPGDNCMSLSTMGCCSIVCEQPAHDPRRSLGVKPNPGFDYWSIEGSTRCSLGSYQWYRDTFGMLEKTAAKALNAKADDLFTHEIAQSPPGAQGVNFVPYLQGSWGAKPNAGARGVFVGMTVGTRRCDMARAVVEGILFELYDIVECERAAGVPLSAIRLTGNVAGSPLWGQMMADILRLPVEMPEVPQSGALGAAMLAGVGAGVYKDLYDAADRMVRTRHQYLPNPSVAKIYEESFDRYLAIIEGLEYSNVF